MDEKARRIVAKRLVKMAGDLIAEDGAEGDGFEDMALQKQVRELRKLLQAPAGILRNKNKKVKAVSPAFNVNMRVKDLIPIMQDIINS